MSSKTVLLIDDDASTRQLFEAILSYHDINLMLAESETEAFDILSRAKPDIIVLDIVLPGNKDGFKILRRIRDLSAIHCPIVATTAYYTLDSVPEFERRGFDGHLLKPIKPDTLVDYLEQVISSFN
jgi:CheY-like chemotaxis protein